MNKMPKAMLAILLASMLVMAGCSSTPTAQPVNGGEGTTYQLTVDLLGEEHQFLVDSQGVLKSKVEISSADGVISLSVDESTVLLDQDGEPLRIIDVTIDSNSSLSPEGAYIVGTAYDLRPQGATFTPQLWLTLSYNPEELPDGVREKDLYIAYHSGTEWHKLPYKRVDTNIHSVTTQIYHFTVFAILAPKELAPSSPPTPPQGTQAGDLAPDFQLLTLDQEPVSLGDLRGTPVVLNFWATYCSPCVQEMPMLEEAYQEYSDQGLILLAINIEGSKSKVNEFLLSQNLSLPVLLDTGVVAERYGILYIPTTFFIDKDGIIQEKKIGAFFSEAELEEKLTKIMP